MASLKVAVVDVASNGGSGFLDVMPFRQVGFLILERPKPALDLDIVTPTALTIHALVHMVLLKELIIFRACELTALIRVQNLWPGHAGCLFADLYVGFGVQCIIQLPPDDTTAVLGNDSC